MPVEWLSEGRTASCGPGCQAGCEFADDVDAFDADYPEPVSVPAMNTKRLLMHDYDPRADSTPGMESVHASYPGYLVLYVQGGFCECGCDQPRASRSRFLPGHDAKLKGKLMRALAADAEVALVGVDGEIRITPAADVARYYNWYDKVRSGAERLIARSTTPIAAEKRLAAEVESRKDGLVEFGRWDKTGRAMASWRLADGSLEVKYVTPSGTIEVVNMAATG